MNESEGKIPHYINDPVINRLTAPENKLYRPTIDFRKAAFVVVIFIIATIFLSCSVQLCLIFYQKGDTWQGWAAFLSVYWRLQLLILCLSLKHILIWLIRVYQRYARSETRLRCCFEPSCSEYAILALKKYGVIIGSVKTINRLFRCHPPGGIDYP